MRHLFRKFSEATSRGAGSPWTFIAAVMVVVVWAATGPIFNFSNTWQLVINTGTTIVTFLMVFLIQNTQNRDSKAIHLKLDELLRAMQGARTGLVDLEDMTDDELNELQKQFADMHQQLQTELRERKLSPEEAKETEAAVEGMEDTVRETRKRRGAA